MTVLVNRLHRWSTSRHHGSPAHRTRSTLQRIFMPVSAAILSLAACFAALTAHAATPVDAREYGLQIEHRVLSQVALDDGKTGLELELTLRNTGEHALYDLRLFLLRAGPVSLLPECEPARVRILGPGDQDGVTWTFECFIAPLPDIPLNDVQFRVEAVDQSTRQIVSFVGASVEGR